MRDLFFETPQVEKLVFQNKISGVRVDLSDKLRKEMGDFPRELKPNDVPDFVKYGIWWSNNGLIVEVLLLENGGAKVRPPRYINKEQPTFETDCYETLYDNLWGTLDHDDHIKVWLYNNRKDLWQQLVDHFGSEKEVFDNYIRFNH